MRTKDYWQGNEMARRQGLVLCCRPLPDELGAFCKTFEGYSLFSPHGWKIYEEHAFPSCLKRLLSPKKRSVNYSKEREIEREVKEGQGGGREEQTLADVCTRPCSVQQVCMWTLLALELDSQGTDHGLDPADM